MQAIQEVNLKVRFFSKKSPVLKVPVGLKIKLFCSVAEPDLVTDPHQSEKPDPDPHLS